MILETVDISDISQDPANVRKHSERNLESIAASLRAFGQQKPIVVDKRGVILAGNGTYEAAKRIGWDKIKITRTDLSGTLATAYAIADNRTAELAEWDDTALAEQLRALQSEEFDLSNVGYTDDEVQQLIDGIGNEILGASEVTEDEIPEPPIEPITKPGDLWLLGDHRLLCGDSTKAEDVGRLMNGEKADLCFTSPPYNVGTLGWAKESKYQDDGDNKPDFFGFLNKFTKLAIEAASVCIVNIQMVSGNKISVIEYLHEWKNHVADIAIWDKQSAEPAMEQGVLDSAFEFLMILSQKKNPKRKLPMTEFRGGAHNVHRAPKQTSNIASAIHAATFPLHLPSWGFGVFSLAKIVYDPFLGSGTTLIAAEQFGRKCYGMEISPQYCDVIVKRWESLTGRVATRA